MIDRITAGQTDLVPGFLALGNPATATDVRGVSLIKWCAYYGDVRAIKAVVEAGESLAALGDNLDLNAAVFHAYPELCEYLIEQGADVNYPLAETGEMPLHSAFCKPSTPGFERIVELLLAKGARPDVQTRVGIETGGFMRDVRTRAETPLHRAAAYGSAGSIDNLLQAGALKEVKDINGDSPLSWASWHLRPRSILSKLCYGEYRV